MFIKPAIMKRILSIEATEKKITKKAHHIADSEKLPAIRAAFAAILSNMFNKLTSE